MEYRVEDKYIVTDAQIVCLQSELQSYMKHDSHIEEDAYLIRSVYFDDMCDSCLCDNEIGTDEREKFRIRTYNNDKSLIQLEQKSKTRGYTSKRSERISLDDCMKYIRGEIPDMNKEDGFLKKKLYVQASTRMLSPKCIVEYERTAFVEPMGNVRITFDKNISGTFEAETFWDEVLPGIPVLPSGQHILEVKYDEFLPDYIRKILNTGTLQRTSYSKYYYARVNQNIE